MESSYDVLWLCEIWFFCVNGSKVTYRQGLVYCSCMERRLIWVIFTSNNRFETRFMELRKALFFSIHSLNSKRKEKPSICTILLRITTFSKFWEKCVLNAVSVFWASSFLCMTALLWNTVKPRILEVTAKHFRTNNDDNYMVDGQMKVFRSLNNTSYLVTMIFDWVISSDRSSLIIRFLLFFLTLRSATRHWPPSILISQLRANAAGAHSSIFK